MPCFHWQWKWPRQHHIRVLKKLQAGCRSLVSSVTVRKNFLPILDILAMKLDNCLRSTMPRTDFTP